MDRTRDHSGGISLLNPRDPTIVTAQRVLTVTKILVLVFETSLPCTSFDQKDSQTIKGKKKSQPSKWS